MSEHRGHTVEVGVYGTDLKKDDYLLFDNSKIHNLALECLDCNEVIVDYDITEDMPILKARYLISEAIKEILV